MAFLFGNKDYYDLLGYITMQCPSCNTQRIFSVNQQREKLTVYFIPTFQFSSRQIITCEQCKETFQVDEELKPEVAENMISQKKLDSLIKRGKLDYLTNNVPKRRKRRVARLYCPECKHEIEKSMLYCPQCGNKL
ncbi:MAG: zinc-ribbon domain-containing protein [Dehalococcoidales bacterium]|nr:zinc-ribbon domain-containing protein [Dehalococcoidales bacterium]